MVEMKRDILAHGLLTFLPRTHTVGSEETFRSSVENISMLHFYNPMLHLIWILCSNGCALNGQEKYKTAKNTGMTKEFIVSELFLIPIYIFWPVLNLQTQVHIILYRLHRLIEGKAHSQCLFFSTSLYACVFSLSYRFPITMVTCWKSIGYHSNRRHREKFYFEPKGNLWAQFFPLAEFNSLLLKTSTD